MTRPPLCVTWTDHHSNFISAFRSLFDDGTLVDVTLAAEGRSIKAHKVVLSACSSYFRSLFIENPCKHPIVILKDVQYADLKLVVDFMYHGKIQVPEEQMRQFSELVNTLGINESNSTPLTKSVNQPIKRADSVTPNIELVPAESVHTSTRPTPAEKNSNKCSSDQIIAQKSTSITQTSQYPQFNTPYPPYNPPAPYTPYPLYTPHQPSSSSQTNLGGMSSGGNQKYLSQSHTQRKRMENTVQQLVYREGSTPNKQQQQQHKQQMINQTSASEALSAPQKRKLSSDELYLQLALSKMRHGTLPLTRVAKIYNVNEEILRSRCEELGIPTLKPFDSHLISQQNLTASVTATSTDINSTSTESSERPSQSSANITVPQDDSEVFDVNHDIL